MKKQICLFLFLVLAYNVQICPKEPYLYTKTVNLSKEVMKFKSEELDAFYSIQKNSSKYALKGYKIQTFQTESSSKFDIVQFQKPAQITWQIVSVSKKGNCVGVLISNDTFVAYNTGANTFIETQKISTKNYFSKKFQTNDDCLTVHLKLSQNGDNKIKIFQNSQQINQSLQSTATIFDSTFKYAINSLGQFLILQNNSYIIKLKSPQNIKPNLIQIIYNQQQKALISITKDPISKQYSLFIFNHLNLTSTYIKFFKSNQQNTLQLLLKFDIKQNGKFIIVRNNQQMIHFLQINIIMHSRLTFNEYKLQKQQFKTLFDSKSQLSINNNIIFVYKNSKVYHFIFYQNVIYFLGDLKSDFNNKMLQLRLQSNTLELKSGFMTFLPSKLQYCNVIKDASQSESSSEVQNFDTPSYSIDQNGIAAKCNTNCISCDIGGRCRRCASGNALVQGQCIPCNNCRICMATNTSVCIECFWPKILNQSTNLCLKPICTDSNCLQCSLDKKCTICNPGYTLTSSNSCQKCQIQSCKICSSNVSQCDQCQQGQIYFQNNLLGQYICQSCAAGCKECFLTDISHCKSCLAGFYLAKDLQSDGGVERCFTCLQNCRQCTNLTTCIKCTSQMLLSVNKTSCQPKCSQNCLTCQLNDTNKCLTCYSGTQLDPISGRCISDISCNLTQTCAACSLGFVVFNSSCYKCTYQDNNCISCNYPNVSVCTKCSTGYYPQDNKCNKCSNQCLSCVSQFSCAVCVSGYYLKTKQNNPTGICLTCSSQCKSCKTTASICTQCIQNETLVNAKCISNNNVQLVMTLNIPLQNLISIKLKVIEWLINAANKYRDSSTSQLKVKDFVLRKTSRGSAIINGTLSTQSSIGTNAISSGLSQQMNQKPIIAGYTMIGSSIKANIAGNGLIILNPQQISNNLGLILGLSIPLGILIVLGIIVMIKKLSNRRKKLYVDQGTKQYQNNDNSRDFRSLESIGCII